MFKLRLLPLLLLAVAGQSWAQPTSTTTALTISTTSVAFGSSVTLTAIVKTGVNPVTPGTVRFCNATAATCLGSALFGQAQLTANGSASMQLALPIGIHSIKAEFGGTKTALASTSGAQTVTVTGLMTSSTSTAASAGSPYTITATVTGNGTQTLRGNVSFVDASNGNYPLGASATTGGSLSQTFTAVQEAVLGSEPIAVAVGDLNRDGYPDIVVGNLNPNSNGQSTLQLSLSSGSHYNLTSVNLPSSVNGVSALAMGDFNNDGNLDLAIVSGNANYATILFGDGTGNLSYTGASFPTGSDPNSIVAVDFNADGNLDLAITNQFSSNITILLGNGQGNFSQALSSPATGSFPYAITSSDFNGDGIPDLAVANYYDNDVTVLLGNGDGTFAPVGSPVVGVYPDALAAADFNGDGKQDLAVVNAFSKTVSILINDGHGNFTAAAEAPVTGNNPDSVAIADFNGDGVPDLAVANSNDNTVGVLFGKGDGTFPGNATISLPAGTAPYSVNVADLNADGFVDLVVAGSGNNTAVMLINTVTNSASASLSGVTVPGGGTHNVIALYQGNSTYGASMSPPVALAGTPVSTTLSLSANPAGTVAVGETVQLTATLSPSLVGSISAGGNVSLYSGSQLVAVMPVAYGTAVVNLLASAGTRSYSAKYSGDTNFVGSTSVVVSITAIPTATTTTVLSTSASSVTSGSAVTFTATVASGASPVTRGSVAFCNANAKFCEDAAILGKAQLTASGTATVHVALPLGTASIKAVFSGATQFSSSVSASKTVTVTASGLGTATSLALSGNPGNYQLTGTVTGSWPGPTGNVSFVDSSNKNLLLASASLSTPLSSFAQSAVLTVPSTMVSFAVADFNGDGKPDMAVANVYSNSVSIFIGNGAGTFTAKSAPITGSPNFNAPFAVAAGDFNGDGVIDLAVGNGRSSGLTILIGNGDGTFAVRSNPAAGVGQSAIAAADFNGDGKLDLAVLDNTSNSVSILLGNGDGTFTANALTFSVGSNAFAMATADFNGDGKPDLAIANYNSNNVTILLGIGDGSFSPGPVSPSTGKGPFALAVGDFNQDGLPDLATMNEFDSTITILLNQGNGLFSTASTLPSNDNPYAITAADFNGDGLLDLAVVSSTDNSVLLLTSLGNGTFTNRTIALTSGTGPIAIAAGDFNQDGALDMVVGDFQTSDIRVLLNSATSTASYSGVTVPGGGTHQLEAIYSGTAPYLGSTSAPTAAIGTQIPTTVFISAPTVAAGAVAPITVTVLPASEDNFTVTGTVTLYNGSTPYANATLTNGQAAFNLTLAAGTYNLSAKYSGNTNFSPSMSVTTPLYVAVASTTVLAVSASTVPSGTPITLTATVTSGGKPVTHGVVTFFDGSVPLAASDLTASGTAALKRILGIGAHSIRSVFSATSADAGSGSASQTITVTGLYPTTTTLTDSVVSGTSYALTATVSGAGVQPPSGSVSFVNTSANSTLGMAALGAGTTTLSFSLPSSLTVGSAPYAVVSQDFNRDGNLDMAVTNTNSGTVTILLGSGTGVFTAKSTIPVGASPYGIAAADFNADGVPDLAVANFASNTITILIGNGDGTFIAKTTLTGGGAPDGIAIGDFNLDGKLDLAVTNSLKSTVSIFIGNGDGTFGAPSLLSGFGAPSGIAVGDFNGDGKPDLAIADGYATVAEILLGDGKGGFAIGSTVPTGFAPVAVAVGDFNGDGKLDVALAVYNLGAVSVALGNGNGTFAAPTTISLGSQSRPEGIVIADFNQDGKLDLAVSESSTNKVDLLLGKGDGTFILQSSAISTGTNPALLAVGDFTGDGKPDLAVPDSGSNSIAVFLNSLSTKATATLSGVAISGTANQNVQGKYSGIAPYAASTSNVLSLPPI